MGNYLLSFLAFVFLTGCLFVEPSKSSPAATHLHTSRDGIGEREGDGAYSPRDGKHLSSGEHHAEFDHEAILGEPNITILLLDQCPSQSHLFIITR